MTHQHKHAKKKSKSIIPGFDLSFGIVMAILGIIVVIPLCSLVVFSARLSLSEFWQTITRPRVLSSYAVSLSTAFIASLINAVMGLILAWVLVRVLHPFNHIQRRYRGSPVHNSDADHSGDIQDGHGAFRPAASNGQTQGRSQGSRKN